MRAVFLIGLSIFIVVGGSAQTAYTSLPNWLIDSMAYEIKLGRQCSEVSKAQSIELEKQGLELVATGTALKISQNETKTLSELLLNAKQGQEILTMQFDKDRKELKRKVRKRNAMIFGETLVIVGLILLL